MGLRVNTNIASINAQRNTAQVTTRLARNYQRLSTGLRISTAADDADFSISSQDALVETAT